MAGEQVGVGVTHACSSPAIFGVHAAGLQHLAPRVGQRTRPMAGEGSWEVSLVAILSPRPSRPRPLPRIKGMKARASPAKVHQGAA